MFPCSPASTGSSISIPKGIMINGLGDSITAAGYYQSSALASSYTVKQWLPSTAYTTVTDLVQNGGNIYQCSQSGTSASSGGPTGTASSVTDGGAHWAYLSARSSKQSVSFLTQMEMMSLGMLNFDLSQGYDGVQNSLVKCMILTSGTAYAPADTITFNNGAKGTLVLNASGGITGVTITDPGCSNGTTVYTYSITTSTGSGAIISLVAKGSGTFGVGGCTTGDMVARLPDVVASKAKIITVLGGINDITVNTSAAVITANLKICYDTLQAAGKAVIAICTLPCANLTQTQSDTLQRVNRWIRDYCLLRPSINTNNYSNIALADPTRYLSDGSGAPIGGTGGVANAMTIDGKHPTPRGAQYIAISCLNAMKKWIPNIDNTSAHSSSYLDGYDPTLNPSGNVLEGRPWVANTDYSTVGMLVANDTAPVKTYRLVTAGTSAGSGGPTGTSGSNVTDGTCSWRYVSGQGLSTFGSGSTAVPTIGSVVGSGNLATGWTLSRTAGSAVGTIVGAIENPWSDGQVGSRQSLVFSVGSGTVNEQYNISAMNGAFPFKGLNSGDFGTAYLIAEAEVEISSVANLVQLYLRAGDASTQYFNDVGIAVATQVQGYQMMQSAGEPLVIPNSGKLLLRTQPMLMPATLVAQSLWLTVGFDASGGAASATLTLKINKVELRKAFIL